jgi:hypothetical protein
MSLLAASLTVIVTIITHSLAAAARHAKQKKQLKKLKTATAPSSGQHNCFDGSIVRRLHPKRAPHAHVPTTPANTTLLFVSDCRLRAAAAAAGRRRPPLPVMALGENARKFTNPTWH